MVDIHNNIVLSIIIPIKISEYNTFLLSRLESILEYFYKHPKIEYIIVDSTEISKYSRAIQLFTTKSNNIHYIHIVNNEPYSSAKSRNKGSEISNGKYLVFFDVDLIAKKDYFIGVINDIKLLESKCQEAFTVYPCLYLNENYSRDLEDILSRSINFDLCKELAVAREECLIGKKDKVLYPAINTSTILVNKKHFLKIGGYDEDFSGHGYEDFFLLHMLSYYYPLAKKDNLYSLDDKTDYPGLYRGFRQYFSYYSLENLFKGMYTVHLFHERNKDRPYYIQRDHNSMVFQSKIRKLGVKNTNSQYIIYDNYQKFISKIKSKYKYNRNQIKGLYRPILTKNLGSCLYRLFRKSRKLILNPKIFFLDIRLEKYKY